MNNKFIALVLFLSALGAINWGLTVYNEDYNLVTKIPGGQPVQKFFYYLIAVCGVFGLYVAWKFLQDEVVYTQTANIKYY
jgi:uncharacterized membrane protein YuzA (DUF378 family)